jgi:hypothetical protein
LKRKIEAMEQGSEERKMGVTEWRRLKRIPQESTENSIIWNYISDSIVFITSDYSMLTFFIARMAHISSIAFNYCTYYFSQSY